LDLLTYLVRRLRAQPLCMLVTWRSDEVSSEHRLRQLLGEAQRMGIATPITLARLNAEAVGELVAARALPPSLGTRLYDETEGLPFFVVEYLNAMEQQGEHWSLPVAVRDLLRARVQQVNAASRQVLDTAAVLGRSFDLNTLPSASGRGDEEVVNALDELLARGLIREVAGGSQYDFTHEKLRALVYAELSGARRRLLHRRAGDTLAQRLHGRELSAQASLIAQHYQLAGQSVQAAEYFKRAGEHARAVYAHAEALAHFRRALALGHPDAAALHEAIGDVLTLRAEYTAALTSYETALALQPPRRAALAHKVGAVHARRGDWEVADVHLQTALAALEEGDHAERARVLADRSLVANALRRSDEALDFAQRALQSAARVNDARALAQSHNVLGMLLRHRGDSAQARAHLEQSLRLAEEQHDVGARTAVLNNLALLHGEGGEWDEAIRLAEAALQLCVTSGDRHREAALHNNLADLLHTVGRQAEAMAHLKQAVAIFAEIGSATQPLHPEIWKLTEW
ncbi:MAG: tetratricopeptide repeat protein, partial [Chloroflexi bacterium]|nr:tetratricopeptide repeat protein [Chloroflexota bacterium]